MTIDEAIKILEDAIIGVEALDDPDLPDAIKLGKEALKWVRENRTETEILNYGLLPGETRNRGWRKVELEVKDEPMDKGQDKDNR